MSRGQMGIVGFLMGLGLSTACTTVVKSSDGRPPLEGRYDISPVDGAQVAELPFEKGTMVFDEETQLATISYETAAGESVVRLRGVSQ